MDEVVQGTNVTIMNKETGEVIGKAQSIKARRILAMGADIRLPDFHKPDTVAQQVREIAGDIAKQHMSSEDRAAIEEEAGVTPVDYTTALLEEIERRRAEAAIAAVDAINAELEHNPGVLDFLQGLHNAVQRAGKPIPRKLLIDAGATKKDLDKMIRKGILREVYLRHHETKQLYACIDLPLGVTFYGNRVAAIVQAPDEEQAQLVHKLVDTVDSGTVDSEAHLDAFGRPAARHKIGD